MLVALFVGAGCAGGGEDAVGATVPTLASSTSTTAADPYAVPEEITVEYLQRVFDVFDEIEGDATRLIVAAGEVTPDAEALLASIYTERGLALRLQAWVHDLESGLARYRDVPGDAETSVLELRNAESGCVRVLALYDATDVARDGPAPLTLTYELVRVDPGGRNPTPWKINFDVVGDQPQEPGPCAA